MAVPSRTAQFTRLHKILKKHYHPIVPDPNRLVLEHLLFACCLENAHYAAAEEAFAAMVHTFFDWNEIRVSSVRELSEVMANLPDPTSSASRFKRILQSIFEATYSFDLEELRKLSLGTAVERLEKIEGTTKFSTSYVVQAALGGHSIPLDSGTLGALALVGLAAESDVAAGVVPGLERAIPKNCGLEFASLLHQLGADFVATPFAPALHAILLEIEPDAKGRLPSRRAKKPEPVETAPSQAAAPPENQNQEERPKKAGTKKKGDRAGGVKAAGSKETAGSSLPPTKTPSAPEIKASRPAEPTPGEVPARKKERAKPADESASGEKSTPEAPARRASRKKPEPKTKGESGSASASSPAEGLSKRKPR
jgi:endonuclease-3